MTPLPQTSDATPNIQSHPHPETFKDPSPASDQVQLEAFIDRSISSQVDVPPIENPMMVEAASLYASFLASIFSSNLIIMHMFIA